MTKFYLFLGALLTLATTGAHADWVGNPIDLSAATAHSLISAMEGKGYPEINSVPGGPSYYKTGVTPELSCDLSKSACNLIILSKDIPAKDCSTFGPASNPTDVSLSSTESKAVIDRYNQGGFSADGASTVEVGSSCGGLILECQMGTGTCTAHIYSF